MKEAIAILTGGGPAPGMNTVVGSVAKTFLRKGYRVIGLHEGYTGLFNPSPRMVDIDYPMADGIFNQGGSFLQMSRFKPKDSDFENNFNLKFFTDNNVKLLVTVGGDDTASTANRIAKFLEARNTPSQTSTCPRPSTTTCRCPKARRRSVTSRPRTRVPSSHAPSTWTPARAATGSYWLPWAAAPATWHSASARPATTR